MRYDKGKEGRKQGRKEIIKKRKKDGRMKESK
jgi:hypothetical protein